MHRMKEMVEQPKYDHLENAYAILENNFEQLLEDLPQDKFSKASTPAHLVIEEVEKNTYLKDITKDDVKDIISESVTRGDLEANLTDYFEL